MSETEQEMQQGQDALLLPAVPLRGETFLPGMVMHFDIQREKSMRAVEEAMTHDEHLFLITQREIQVEEPTLDDLYHVGVIAEIRQVVRLPKGVFRVLAEAQHRAVLLDFAKSDTLLRAAVEPVPDTDASYLAANRQEAMLRTLREVLVSYAGEGQRLTRDVLMQLMDLQDIGKLVDQTCLQIPLTYERQQRLLDAVDLETRYGVLCGMIANEAEISRIRVELQKNIRARIDKNQKEYILREQLKEIRSELGDDNAQSELQKYREQTEALQAPKEVKERLAREIRRLESLAGNPSESGVARGYIETLLGLPWNKASRDNRDLAKARRILAEGHYGLDKVKERILEYLAVRLATKKGEAPILCLVGPPGTGKTSISKSIAEALHKTYVRISLGGVRDEAEIRGHRRTYVGAMPGRIAEGLAHAGVKNPLLLLDEIDKTSSDYKGDIASALLEVLDPEENEHFSDHYVELPIDLSDVLFIATANDVQTIPRPLLDRMELIEINSYTENEKLHIAREHLLPKQIRANGLKKGQLFVDDDALKTLIGSYTREAGVRDLERQIGHICRKTTLMLQEKKTTAAVHVTAGDLETLLGRAKYTVNMANKKPEVGIVRGLAWTSVGGTTLEIEVNVMPGKGSFLLTGQMGDVMKESAQTGISFVRAVAPAYSVAENYFAEHDIHIHIPEGAVPKDGPSAGITMATAILSAVTGIPVRADLAMTGEVTLRGRVLPIGGLKEKLLAAKKAGITQVLVPRENRPDVSEMDAEITDGLTITFVQEMHEVLAAALLSES